MDVIAEYGDDVNDAVLRTGDLRPVQPTGHVCVMYRAEQIPGLVAQAGGAVAAMSASNWSSLGDPQALARLEADPAHWSRFLDYESWACRQPGCFDGGTHLIFAAGHRQGPPAHPGGSMRVTERQRLTHPGFGSVEGRFHHRAVPTPLRGFVQGK